MTDDPREEARRRIVSRLNGDDFPRRHLGIPAHAEDIADAVLEVFPVAFWVPGFPDVGEPERRYLAIRADADFTVAA